MTGRLVEHIVAERIVARDNGWGMFILHVITRLLSLVLYVM